MDRSTTRSVLIRLALILTLAALGFAVNTLPLPLLFGVDLLFGSTVALLALLWLGPGAALLVSLIGNSWTLVLWGHPYAMLTLGAEMICIAWLRARALERERPPLPLAVASALYWLFAGIPLVVLCYRYALDLSWSQTLLIALKQPINGILNAALAGLIALGLASLRRRRGSLTLAELVFSALLAASLFPALLMTLWSNHRLGVELEHDLELQQARFLSRALEDAQANTETPCAQPSPSHLTDTFALILPPGSDPRLEVYGAGERAPVPLDGRLHLLAAPKTGQPRIAAYRQGRYWLARACPSNLDCRALAIHLSTAPLIARVQHLALSSLAMLMGLALGAVLIAWLASRSLERVLRELVRSARALPLKPGQTDPWPAPRVGLLVETEALAITLKQVAGSLDASFRALEREQHSRQEALDRLRQSDARYRLVVEHLEDLLARTDAVGRVEFASPSYCRFFQIDACDLIGGHFTPLVHPQDRATTAAAIASLFEPPHRCRFEHRVHGREGWRWLQWSQRAVLGESDEVVAMIALGRDITERKMAEEALASERQRLANIIEGTRLGTWEWNPRTGKTWLNPRWAEICGYSLAELEPVSIETWRRLVHPEDLEISNLLLEHHLQGYSERYECEVRMRHKQGHWIWVHDQGQVVQRDADGRPLLLAGTHVDISERQEALQQLAASEQRLRTILDHAPIGIFMLDAERRLEYVNASFAALVGRPIESLRGEVLDAFIHADDQRREMLWFRDLCAGQCHDYRLNMRYPRPDGHILWGDLRMVRLPSEPDARPRAIGMVEDITNLVASNIERAALEARLRRYSGELEALIDLSTAQSDAEEIAALLRFACRCLGMEAATLSQCNGREERLLASAMLEPEAGLDSARLHAWLARLSDTPEPAPEAETLMPWQAPMPFGESAAGEGLLIGLSYAPSDPGAAPVPERLLLWSRRPRPALERTEEQLLRLIGQRIRAARHDILMRQRLVEASERETIGHLASGIAHDFNNLLGAFEANLQYLHELLLPREAPAPLAAEFAPEVAEVLEDTRGALHHAQVITSGMLSLNRTGQIPLEPVALAPLGDELGRLLTPLLPDSIEMVIAIDANLQARSHGPFLLAALLNLALNARDAMPEGGRLEIRARRCGTPPADPVRIGKTPHGPHAEILVGDNGRGMSEAVLERIFEPLFSTKGAGRGHGLGLFMVQEFVLRSGAALAVDSQPGAGTRFRLLFELAEAEHQDGQPFSHPPEHPSPEHPPVIRRLLVVDDDPAIRDSLARLLAQAGFEVALARDGIEALEVLETETPIDLVLSDIEMPRLDGVTLAERLERQHPGLPLLLMTGQDVGAAAVGARPLLRKPLDPQGLLRAIKRALG